MLVHLSITNVVLIDQLSIAFERGLCALTGETGAGKSILLDSLGLALGVRAESGLVRKGVDSASVTASFQLHDGHPVYQVLADCDLLLDDDILLLRRVVYRSGKSRAFINDQPVTVAFLRQVGDALVEIHGQFDTQGLLNPQTHRAMLDAYAGVDGARLGALWAAWQDDAVALDEMTRRSSQAQEDQEYLKFSLQDLDQLAPQKGEEDTLSALRERLKHRSDILEALARADMILSAENDPVQTAWAELDRVSDKAGDDLADAIAALSRASSEIAEACSLIQAVSSGLQDGEYNLEEVDERLHALRMQARKHGCSPDELPEMYETLQARLYKIENADDILAAQREKCEALRAEYVAFAQEVRAQRKKVAQRLNDLVAQELAPLKLDKARFVTDVSPLDEVEWGAHGIDQIRFLVATNPGAEPGPIHKIASGGEMSRFMLALKVVIAQAGSTHSFIFDEVDAGIGGATADAVGQRLARLADGKQVLVVTHAPQVAAQADYHWIVRKSGDAVVTTDIVPLLTRAERCEEIARMLSGADITSEARAAAEKLLGQAA